MALESDTVFVNVVGNILLICPSSGEGYVYCINFHMLSKYEYM